MKIFVLCMVFVFSVNLLSSWINLYISVHTYVSDKNKKATKYISLYIILYFSIAADFKDG